MIWWWDIGLLRPESSPMLRCLWAWNPVIWFVAFSHPCRKKGDRTLHLSSRQETANRESRVSPHVSCPDEIRQRDLSDISGRVTRPCAVAEAISQIFQNIKWLLWGTRRAHMDVLQPKQNHHLHLFKLQGIGVCIDSLRTAGPGLWVRCSKYGSLCEGIGGGSGQQETHGGRTTLSIWLTPAQTEHFNLIESFWAVN